MVISPVCSRIQYARMPRNISFALTTAQLRAHTKTVTRRNGWKFLKAGDRLTAVVKSRGLKRGEHPEKIAQLQVLSVRRERLDAMILQPGYGAAEVIAEGFPDMPPQDFVAMFCKSHDCRPHDEVTRIEFGFLD